MTPISLDLRGRIVRVCEAGHSTNQEVAERVQVSLSSVKRFVRLFRNTGHVEAQPQSGGAPCKLDETGQDALKEVAKVHTDWPQEEMAQEVASRTGIGVSQSTLSRQLNTLGVTRKKNETGRRTGTSGCEGRPSGLYRRHARSSPRRPHRS